MKCSVALLLVICIMALGVRGQEGPGSTLSQRESFCKGDVDSKYCRRCTSKWGLPRNTTRYTRSIEKYYGSIATVSCNCPAFGDVPMFYQKQCMPASGSQMAWKELTPCCPLAGQCHNLDASYDATLGRSFGSAAYKACNISCAVGKVGLIKRQCERNTQLWSNPDEDCECHNAFKRVNNDDCWGKCNHKSGPCSACGDRGGFGEFRGFCCKKNETGSLCTDEQQNAARNFTSHVCVASRLGWQMVNKDNCLSACGQEGRCPSCDNGKLAGYCCQKGSTGCSAEKQSVAGDGTHPVCVVKPGKWEKKNRVDCWHNGCKGTAGECNACDFGVDDGYCCRKGWTPGRGVLRCNTAQKSAASSNKHVCVVFQGAVKA